MAEAGFRPRPARCRGRRAARRSWLGPIRQARPERSPRVTRIVVNQPRRSMPASEPPGREPMAFHTRLPGYARTPLVDVPDLAAQLDVEKVWVKDESSRLGLPSFKILGASWAVYRALDRHVGGLPEWNELDDLVHALTPYRPLALAAATDGNHGRAVAHMAVLLRLDVRIFVPAGTAAARSNQSRARAPPARSWTGPTTTPSIVQPRRSPATVSSSQTRRGPATKTCPCG